MAAKHVKSICWMRRPELIQPLGPFGGRYPMHFLMASERPLLHQFPSIALSLFLSLCFTRKEYMHLIKVLVARSSSESIHIACIDTRQRKSPVQLTTPPTSNQTERTERNSSAKPFGQYHPPSQSCWRKLLFGQ